MRRIVERSVLLTVLTAVAIVGGCNVRPEMPRRKWYENPIETVEVSQTPEERVAVAAVETARRKYRGALKALIRYYGQLGDIQKRQWARRELQNLDETQTFTWRNMPTVETPPPPPDDADERTLVEATLAARKEYRQAVDALARYYENSGDDFKAYVIHTMQSRFRPEETFMYLYSIELPPVTLKPTQIIKPANQLYDRALSLYNRATAARPFVDYNQLRESLRLFDRLIREFPRSTRIAQTAYYIGKMYGEFFDEHYLATLWYKRALTFDANVPLPVRYDLAWQYDEHMGDPVRAIAWYKAAMKYEPWFDSQYRFAAKRVEELIEELPAGREEPDAAPQSPPVEKPRGGTPTATDVPPLRPGPTPGKPAEE